MGRKELESKMVSWSELAILILHKQNPNSSAYNFQA